METETKYNVYGNESSPKLTYKYVGGSWQKQYKIYDYLGSLRYTISQMNTVLNYKAYDPYGNELIDTMKQTRQGYIGKENDVENGLGDHGVRKYDPGTGRFNSVDPLWEEYYGWSPYNYCQNNPITNSDPSGDQFFTLGIDPIWMSTFNDAAVAPKPLWWGISWEISVNIPAPALPPGPIIIDIKPIDLSQTKPVSIPAQQDNTAVSNKPLEMRDKSYQEDQAEAKRQKREAKKAESEAPKPDNNQREHTQNASKSSKETHEYGKSRKNQVNNDKKRAKGKNWKPQNIKRDN